MMVNKYILVVITLAITYITYYLMDMSFLLGGFITVLLVTLAYIFYINKKQKNRYGILENDLNPQGFIDATIDAYKYAGKNKQLNSLLNIDLAYGYVSLGEFKKALGFLDKVDEKYLPKINKSILLYYNMLMIVYYELGEPSKASEVYKIATGFNIKDKQGQDLINLIKANNYFYQGEYLKSKDMLLSYYKEENSKRLNLEILFQLAKIDEETGNLDEAILKYKKIYDQANKLYIGNLSKEKLKDYSS